jgi:hypothetical protein
MTTGGAEFVIARVKEVVTDVDPARDPCIVKV